MALHYASVDQSFPKTLVDACDHLREGMIVIDDIRQVRYMNPSALRMLGQPDMQGQHPTCRQLLRCGSLDQPNKYCGDCAVSLALQEGVASPHVEVAIGPDDYRTLAVASCSPVQGVRPMAVLIVQPQLIQTELDQSEVAPDAAFRPSIKALRSLVRVARELLHADYAALGTVDGNAAAVDWLIEDGCVTGAKAPVPVGHGIRGRVVGTGGTVAISRYPQDATDSLEWHKTMNAEKLTAALAVPVEVEGERTGVLMIANRTPFDYREEDKHLLRKIAALAGDVMHQINGIVNSQTETIRAEREWLAAELHDGLAQLLAALIQKVKLIRWSLGHDAAPLSLDADLEELLKLSEQADVELRMALGQLRSPGGDDDFPAALRYCVEHFSRRSGMSVILAEVPEEPEPLTGPASLQVIRVIQEALTNARKHSGGDRVVIRWKCDDSKHTFTVTDNGHGIKAKQAAGGYGLTIMADRIRRVGGHLEVISEPDRGCTVRFTVPFPQRR